MKLGEFRNLLDRLVSMAKGMYSRGSLVPTLLAGIGERLLVVPFLVEDKESLRVAVREVMETFEHLGSKFMGFMGLCRVVDAQALGRWGGTVKGRGEGLVVWLKDRETDRFEIVLIPINPDGCFGEEVRSQTAEGLLIPRRRPTGLV